jgi:hypothetical protein
MNNLKILDQPYTFEDLRTLSKDGTEPVGGVVSIPWVQLLQHDEDWFAGEAARRVTGSRVGLADVDAKAVGIIGDEILLLVSGDVSLLIENYAEMMTDEAVPEIGERLHGVDVGRVVCLAKSQIVEQGLHLQADSFSQLHDFCDANMLGFRDDGEHLADGTAYASLGVERAVDVMNRVQCLVDAWLRSGEARRQAEGGDHAS